MVENGDLDWLVKGSASDNQKLAAFDQWLGHNTANPAIVPAIHDYLAEHRQEIDQEVKDHQLTLDNVTDDSAERYMEVLEKINGQKHMLSEHDVLSWALDAVENYYVQDRTAVFISNYLRDSANNSIDKRLKLAIKVVENTQNVRLVKLNPSQRLSKSMAQAKAKEH